MTIRSTYFCVFAGIMLFQSAQVYAVCSGTVVMCNGNKSSSSGGCNELFDEVLVTQNSIQFRANARDYDGTDSRVYYIYTTSSTLTPLTVSSVSSGRNIAIAFRPSISVGTYQAFSPLDVDLTSCSSSSVTSGYIGLTADGGTAATVTQMKVKGSCSFFVKGDLNGPLKCQSIGQLVIVRQLTSSGSIEVSGNCGAMNIGQPTGDHWGLQDCRGSITVGGSADNK